MATVVQKSTPTIKIYSPYNESAVNYYCSYEFCPDSSAPQMSSRNLQSYSYQKSVNNFTGTFQLAVKEETANYKESGAFFNTVEKLDIVEISEDGKNVDFIGVITTKSYTAVANGLNKIINISGKSIEYLFEYVNIPLDCTAMAWTKSYINSDIANINMKLSMKGDGESYSEPAPIKESMLKIYDDFKAVAKDLSNTVNTDILSLIEEWYGTDFIDCLDSLKFKYPISSNLFSNGSVNFINYIRNLLPQNVYEMYGVIVNNKPKIRIREVPFDKKDWINLPFKRIDPNYLTQYTMTQSCEEVYTVFYSYIEGSPISPEFHEILQAIEMGKNSENAVAAYDINKVKKYGYLPLKCNFMGFKKDVAEEVEKDIKEKYKELNNQLKDWYGKLDEMYDATFSVVRDSDDEPAAIGERVRFSDGEYYLTGVEHQWRYGQSITITYHCERGGNYDSSGNFAELKNITKPRGEFE